MNLSQIPTKELEEELEKRNDGNLGRCGCGKWPLVMLASRSWKKELHCYGCRKPQIKCTCY